MYVLTYETRDVLYSVFDSYLRAYEEGTGKLLYRKEYKNAMLNDILFSRGDDDSMLLYGSYEADAVSRKNGEVYLRAETGISGIVYAEAVNGANLYSYITSDGCQYIMSYENNVSFTHGVTFDCFADRIYYTVRLAQGFVMATHTENRAVCYQRFYPTDDTLTDKTPDREDTEVLWGNEVQETAKEKGYVLPKLAEGIFITKTKPLRL